MGKKVNNKKKQAAKATASGQKSGIPAEDPAAESAFVNNQEKEDGSASIILEPSSCFVEPSLESDPQSDVGLPNVQAEISSDFTVSSTIVGDATASVNTVSDKSVKSTYMSLSENVSTGIQENSGEKEFVSEDSLQTEKPDEGNTVDSTNTLCNEEKRLLEEEISALDEKLVSSLLRENDLHEQLLFVQSELQKSKEHQKILADTVNMKEMLIQEHDLAKQSFEHRINNLIGVIHNLESDLRLREEELKILRSQCCPTYVSRDLSDQNQTGLSSEYEDLCRQWKGFLDNLFSDDLSEKILGEDRLVPGFLPDLLGGVWDEAVKQVDQFLSRHENTLRTQFGVTELADWRSCLLETESLHNESQQVSNASNALMHRFILTVMQRHGYDQLMSEVERKISAASDKTELVASMGNVDMLWLHRVIERLRRDGEVLPASGNLQTVLDLYLSLVRFLTLCRMSEPPAFLGPRPGTRLPVNTQDEAAKLYQKEKTTVVVNNAMKASPNSPAELRVMLPGLYFTDSTPQGSSVKVDSRQVLPSYSFIVQGEKDLEELRVFESHVINRRQELARIISIHSDSNVFSVVTAAPASPVFDTKSNSTTLHSSHDGLQSVNVFASLPEEDESGSFKEDEAFSFREEVANADAAQVPIEKECDEEFNDPTIHEEQKTDFCKSSEQIPNTDSMTAESFAVDLSTQTTLLPAVKQQNPNHSVCEEVPQKHIKLGLIVQLLPDMSPFAPQQYVEASIPPMKLSSMSMTQFTNAIMMQLEDRGLCHTSSQRGNKHESLPQGYANLTFAFSTIDMIPIPTIATTVTMEPATHQKSPTSNLLYRKMLRLKKSVYFHDQRAMVMCPEDGLAPADFTVGEFLSDDVNLDAESPPQRAKCPLIVISQLPSLPFESETSASDAGTDSSNNGIDVLPYIDISFVDYSDFPSRLSIPMRLSLKSRQSQWSGSPGNVTSTASSNASTTRPSLFKQWTTFSSSSRNLPQVNSKGNVKIGNDHFTKVIHRLSSDLSAAVSIASKKQKAKCFDITPKMLTLDYFQDHLQKGIQADEPSSMHRVIARLVPQFHWPQDEKERFLKALEQLSMVFDIKKGEYLTTEDILRQHRYNLVVVSTK
jgi:hypothetical protein